MKLLLPERNMNIVNYARTNIQMTPGPAQFCRTGIVKNE